MGRITLKNFKVYSYHGCFDEENKIGSEYILDIWVEGDFSKSEITDCLSDTVDYVHLGDIAQSEMTKSAKLIEHVAGRILNRVSKLSPKIRKSGLVIKKLHPPMNQSVGSVEYAVEWP